MEDNPIIEAALDCKDYNNPQALAELDRLGFETYLEYVQQRFQRHVKERRETDAQSRSV